MSHSPEVSPKFGDQTSAGSLLLPRGPAQSRKCSSNTNLARLQLPGKHPREGTKHLTPTEVTFPRGQGTHSSGASDRNNPNLGV